MKILKTILALFISFTVSAQAETVMNLSYLDIPILGSMVPLRFVAKSEVKHWPILGFLSKLASTLFIKRVRSDSLLQKKKIFKLY